MQGKQQCLKKHHNQIIRLGIIAMTSKGLYSKISIISINVGTKY